MEQSTPQAITPLRWLYLDLNSYFASVEQQLRPELRGRPVAVVPTNTDATCAIAASYEAKALGIKTGTKIWEARRRCPGLACVLADHKKYVEYHHRIIAEVEQHIPITSVDSIDEVSCRLMTNEQAPERARLIAESIKAGMRARIGAYIRCSIGIAPNKFLAKVATDLQKPDGLVVLQAHDLPHRLYELALSDIPGIGRAMHHRLARHGVHTMEQLLALPPKHMRAIWHSVEGERLYYKLRGMDIQSEETRRRTVGHSHVLAPDHRLPERARLVARRLTVKAASRLRRMGYYAKVLHFSARLEKGPRWAAEAKCHRAQDNQTFLHMLEELWRMMQADIGHRRIKKVSVTLYDLIPEHSIQPELFEVPGTRQRARAESLSHAMDTLNARYGRDTVLMGMTPGQGNSFSGTKIAFTRIPQKQEFHE